MKTYINEKFLNEMGSGKLHDVKRLIIEVTDINEKTVELSLFLENKFGLFQICDPRKKYILGNGGKMTIECNENFKIKNRVVIS